MEAVVETEVRQVCAWGDVEEAQLYEDDRLARLDQALGNALFEPINRQTLAPVVEAAQALIPAPAQQTNAPTPPRVFRFNTTATNTNIVSTSSSAGTYIDHSWYVPTTATTSGITITSNTVITVTNGTTLYVEGNGTFYVSTADGIAWNCWGAGGGGSWTPPKPKRGPLIKKSIRNSIKRALSLWSNFGMEEDARIFLGGDSIEVSHPDSLFKFVMKKSRSLIAGTSYPGVSVPYQLDLYTKSNVHVADLCVYMDDTPMLDQLFALTMFVKSGNEAELLREANFRRLTQDRELREIIALECPYLEKKMRLDEVSLHEGRGSIFVPADGRLTVQANYITC